MATIITLPCQQPSCFSCTTTAATSPRRISLLIKKKHQYCVAKAASSSSSSSSGSGNFGCKSTKKTSSVSHESSANVPLRELPGASFDEYMEDKGRVIGAIFPGKSTCRKLNEEEWRVKMSPIQVFFFTCQPVIYITARCISNVEDYPPEVPGHVTKLLEVKITRWELQDLHADYMPSDFNIKARGALYMEKQGNQSLVKNQLDINLSLVFPPLLAWIPEYVLHNFLQSVLTTYVEEINKGFAVRLLADYDSFKRSRPKN